MQPSVDETCCSKDGLCTRVCPSGRLTLGTAGHPIAQADLRCLSCGHCVAACPTGALSLDDAVLEPLPSDWRLDAAAVAQLLKARRSIRAFRAESVPQATLAAMIDVARYAPSGHNSQPLAWTVISARTDVRRIAEATIDWMRRSISGGTPLAAALDMQSLVRDWDAGGDPICREAPHLIVAHAPASLPSAQHGAAIAMTYLDLAAQPLGVGTCWAGFVLIGAGVSPEVHAAIELPEGQKLAGVMMAGRPSVRYLRIPARKQPRIDWR